MLNTGQDLNKGVPRGRLPRPHPLYALLPTTVQPELHFLGVPGIRPLHTPAIQAVREGLQQARRDQAFLHLSGPSGTGKTFSTRALLDVLGIPHYVLGAERARPGLQDLRAVLHTALGLEGVPPKDPGLADALIQHVLHTQRPVLLFDEVHQMSHSCLEYLRYLFDAAQGLCIVLNSCADRRAAADVHPMLATRTCAWLTTEAIAADDVPHAATLLHPIWEDVPPAALGDLDLRHGRGNLRRWAGATRHLQRLLTRTGDTHPRQHHLDRLATKLAR